MSGNCTINTHLSEMISEIVEPLALEYDGCEVQSSEEALAVIDQLNKEVDREGKPPIYNCLEKFDIGSKLQKVARYENSENERGNCTSNIVPTGGAHERLLIKFPHVTGLKNQTGPSENDNMFTETGTGMLQETGDSNKVPEGGGSKAADTGYEKIEDLNVVDNSIEMKTDNENGLLNDSDYDGNFLSLLLKRNQIFQMGF